MQDDKSVFGHIFTSSVALQLLAARSMLRSKNPGFSVKSPPRDLLEAFSNGSIVTNSEQQVTSEITRKVAELDKLLGMMYSLSDA